MYEEILTAMDRGLRSLQETRAAQFPDGLGEEYRYSVRVRALETFANVMDRMGIVIQRDSPLVTFTSVKHIDLRAFKERGLVWSYTVVRRRYEEQTVEEA